MSDSTGKVYTNDHMKLVNSNAEEGPGEDEPDMPVTSARMGKRAPNFQAVSTEGVLDFYEWLGNSWGLLFSHPAPYTPVCTTEMGSLARHSTVRMMLELAASELVRLPITAKLQMRSNSASSVYEKTI